MEGWIHRTSDSSKPNKHHTVAKSRVTSSANVTAGRAEEVKRHKYAKLFGPVSPTAQDRCPQLGSLACAASQTSHWLFTSHLSRMQCTRTAEAFCLPEWKENGK
jgi:hypothetical protein